MKEFSAENVAFVYICINSEEPKWKAMLSKLQLGGQHYLLTNAQSNAFRNAFAITGVPHYFLIDKQGTIFENGSALRPGVVRDKIKKLLKAKA
jgi:hypothetical protein